MFRQLVQSVVADRHTHRWTV